jgi:nucleoside 2-deoxyribosyltransferase
MPLTPSQRVSLIKGISDRLSAEEYPLIDITLQQFSLPWSDSWNGEKSSYVIKMIGDAPDETLVDLARHVGFSFEPVNPLRIDPPFWRKGMLRLFLSHLATFSAYAADLQANLIDYGISAFVAHNDIEPTAEWQTQIETALATCDVLIALLNSGFQGSNWTDQEVGFAMGRGVPTFAVRLGERPYGFISRFQAFDGIKKPTPALAREIFDAFRKNKQTQQKMARAAIALFEDSGSFAQAKARIGYLEAFDWWDTSFSIRVRTALDRNPQISGSWGVLARAQELLKRWEKVVT